MKEFAPSARNAALKGKGGIIQFEISPKNMNKVFQVTEGIQGNIAQTLPYFLDMIEKQEHTTWIQQIHHWKSKYPFSFVGNDIGGKMKPQSVIQELDKQCAAIKEKVIVSTGVGCHQMFAAQYFRWRNPRTFVTGTKQSLF